jgi:hypothetical protein
LRITVFRVVMLCSLIVHWCFEGMYGLHLQGQRASQARNQQ